MSLKRFGQTTLILVKNGSFGYNLENRIFFGHSRKTKINQKANEVHLRDLLESFYEEDSIDQ